MGIFEVFWYYNYDVLFASYAREGTEKQIYVSLHFQSVVFTLPVLLSKGRLGVYLVIIMAETTSSYGERERRERERGERGERG